MIIFCRVFSFIAVTRQALSHSSWNIIEKLLFSIFNPLRPSFLNPNSISFQLPQHSLFVFLHASLSNAAYAIYSYILVERIYSALQFCILLDERDAQSGPDLNMQGKQGQLLLSRCNRTGRQTNKQTLWLYRGGKGPCWQFVAIVRRQCLMRRRILMHNAYMIIVPFESWIGLSVPA